MAKAQRTTADLGGVGERLGDRPVLSQEIQGAQVPASSLDRTRRHHATLICIVRRLRARPCPFTCGTTVPSFGPLYGPQAGEV